MCFIVLEMLKIVLDVLLLPSETQHEIPRRKNGKNCGFPLLSKHVRVFDLMIALLSAYSTTFAFPCLPRSVSRHHTFGFPYCAEGYHHMLAHSLMLQCFPSLAASCFDDPRYRHLVSSCTRKLLRRQRYNRSRYKQSPTHDDFRGDSMVLHCTSAHLHLPFPFSFRAC